LQINALAEQCFPYTKDEMTGFTKYRQYLKEQKRVLKSFSFSISRYLTQFPRFKALILSGVTPQKLARDEHPENTSFTHTEPFEHYYPGTLQPSMRVYAGEWDNGLH
jgi:hypothetical protein